MATKTLNQTLGENLKALMDDRGLSANVLGKRAGLAPNTVGNYLKAGLRDPDTMPTTGKERSAKLTEVEMLARALGVSPLSLLTDPDVLAQQARSIAEVLTRGLTASSRAAAPTAPIIKTAIDRAAKASRAGDGPKRELKAPPMPPSPGGTAPNTDGSGPRPPAAGSAPPPRKSDRKAPKG